MRMPKMTRTARAASLALACAAALGCLLTAQPANAGYFEGKTVTLILPNSAAGPMARYVRTIGPYLSKHLGAKAVRIDMQPGAGGLKGSNALARSAPDGLTIAFTNTQALIMAQLAGSPGVQLDATKLTYLGRIEVQPRTLVVGGKSPIKTVDDIIKLGRPFVYASQGTDEDFYAMVILSDAFGYKMKIVTGYEGDADTALAVIKGDADGRMTGILASRAAAAAGEIRLVTILNDKRLDEYPDVPTVFELLKDQSKKPALEATVAVMNMGRSFFGPPDMKPEVTKELRDAVKATMEDKALLDEMQKAQLDVVFLAGETQQENIKSIVSGGEKIKGLLKEALQTIK
jgi:tripartite-type tricarboxylate transporter receptor subunit TctC